MNKKIQLSILSIFIAAALVGSVSTFGDNMAFAGGNNHDDDKDKEKDKKSNHKGKKGSNDAAQGIGQNTETLQASSCGSNEDTTASCNNVALSFNLNDGNNALGQQ
jgi:ABC-type antimicrobial peptide transport system permease subunit